MANRVTKGRKLKRASEDGNESRSVKWKTTHDVQENGNEQIDIGSLLMNTAEGKLVLDILKLIAAVVNKQKIWRYMSIVHYSTVRLEQKISGETPLENPRCRFCADTPSCPLQYQTIAFTGPPANVNSEKVNEEEKNQVEASKKAVARDEKL
ncbi:uncharacterized protein Bfra_007782 [Botrytis fragariae]|uniref:Uncharacterized protein n=1 Tax=Botrytis fragariae TaxID=1964551 RepID=A0A8H6APG4_9HELO|nr:uncharacterized protein Bfra_007782 [Botrytis fragariae]KAF5871267.1 hypothetical protein Bfra_007782 [Botrytis fragariae]